jgi:Ca2+/Na+ antiporter
MPQNDALIPESIVAGMVLLVCSADFLVKGASNLAATAGVLAILMVSVFRKRKTPA